jgi:hypothetical protein
MPGGGGNNLLPTIVSQSYGKPLNPIIVPVGETFTLFFHGIVTPTYEGQYELGFDWYSGSYFDADPYANPLGSGSVSMVVYPGGVYDPDPPISTPLYYNDYTGSTITLSGSLVNGDTYVYWMRLSQSMTPTATLDGGYAYGNDVYVTFTGSAATGSLPTGSLPTGSTLTSSIVPTEPKKGSWNPNKFLVDEPNRASRIRRDTDKDKNFTVTLKDIDNTINDHITAMQLKVVDAGDYINVPHFYANPERWKAIRQDGFLRDYNGKMQLPAIVFSRTSSEKDDSMAMFNKYLRYQTVQLYTQKNRYTQFSRLSGKNAPVNKVISVVMPDHMIFTYTFIVWTEYVEQMNTILERINFETEDYWGKIDGLRFKTSVDNYSHTTELENDQDRMVKTEFTLSVRGYLLPETFAPGLDGFKSTTEKFFTKKKVIITAETVGTDFNWKTLPNDNNKWTSQQYPNILKDTVVPAPGIDLKDKNI